MIVLKDKIEIKKRTDELWSSPSFLLNGHRVSFARDTAAGARS
jgi:hypothetical protein